MLEKTLDRDNLNRAFQTVKRNKGSHGVDQMPVQSLREHLKTHGEMITEQIRQGTYIPQPVRRVEIPKPSGGTRDLGIPTVTDRFVQQAVSQVLTEVYDPMFSEHSYGFRPKRRGHDAVRKARNYIREGYRWVVDLDLEKFFDQVNHDRLMRTLSFRINDPQVLRLIRRFLQAGVMEDGVTRASTKGTPQGGPISPVLSNIVLDELDQELEKRGVRFVRYADDCMMFTESKRAGKNLMASITAFIEKKLKLRVNREKSTVDRPWRRKFLGISFTPSRKDPKIRIASESIQQIKGKIKTLTSRRTSIPMEERIKRLNQYLTGWLGYFQLTETPSVLREIDSWLKRRLRMIRWKEWKTIRNRTKMLIQHGASRRKAWEWARSRKAYWRIARSPVMHKTLDEAYWADQGLMSLWHRYDQHRWT
ncbi:group II intron reverse transcriptase/maturase [Salsuginibacillus halophilus]|uniref:RNA-directed DNA polymerase n=2 Tax=Salsuginibacillus halophilus TaxID=517424 RepID=A0A2P8HYI7_9BACI|nr:group II intron reverse transcriptase/maturase [Salsuginibacillus halophilus]